MKKNYLIILLVQIIISSAFLFPGVAHSQDLTDAERKERCENNKNRVAELENQLKVINVELMNTMDRKQIETARTHMVFVRSMKDTKENDDDKDVNLLLISSQYQFDFVQCINSQAGVRECTNRLEKIIAGRIDKALTLNRPEMLAKKNDIDKQLAFHRNNLIALRCDQLSKTAGNTGSACFSSDPAMGSTNVDDHYNWAQGQDGPRLEANIKSKINILYNCPSLTDDGFAASFADISVIIAQYADKIASLSNDAGAITLNRSAHYDWAKNQTREQLLQNLTWKTDEAFKSLDSRDQKIFFADISVPIAQASPSNSTSGNTDNPGNNNNKGSTNQGNGVWKVWVKTSPCSGRFDWISVAKANPTAGGNFFYSANQIFPGTNCTSLGCTFEDATKVANSLRASDEFSKYCCKDYTVWKNNQTGKMSAVQGKVGPGFGWTPVKPNLCYDEAQALAKGEETGEWKVWVRTSPCSGRFDWLTLAKENPTSGQNFYYLANSLFPGTTCTTFGCTFEEATAAMEALRPSDQFFKYCCHDYSVWEFPQTGERSIIQGIHNNAGYGWRFVKKELCCEEAEALAGIPGGCSSRSRNQQNIQCGPGSYSAWNDQANKMDCFCKKGLIWNRGRTACIDTAELVKKADCSKLTGSYAAWNEKEQKVSCYCPEGKVWNSGYSACIDDPSHINCIPGSHPAINPETNSVACYCNTGLVLNSTKTACIDTLELVRNADCSGHPGTFAEWNSRTQQVECHCPLGKVWNSTTNTCIDDPSLVNCYPGSHAVYNTQFNRWDCFCNPGLIWNDARKACIDTLELVRTADCSLYPGTHPEWNSQKQQVECHCPQGKVWNSATNTCINSPVTKNNGNNNGGNQGTCNDIDAAAFAKMVGTWKSYRMHITIGGSCDKVTGTWKVTEWCEGVDETYNASTARVNGTLTGKVQQGSLQVNYQSPPSPNNSKGNNSTGSCYLQSNGTLSCSFGCGGDLKKQ